MNDTTSWRAIGQSIRRDLVRANYPPILVLFGVWVFIEAGSWVQAVVWVVAASLYGALAYMQGRRDALKDLEVAITAVGCTCEICTRRGGPDPDPGPYTGP